MKVFRSGFLGPLSQLPLVKVENFRGASLEFCAQKGQSSLDGANNAIKRKRVSSTLGWLRNKSFVVFKSIIRKRSITRNEKDLELSRKRNISFFLFFSLRKKLRIVIRNGREEARVYTTLDIRGNRSGTISYLDYHHPGYYFMYRCCFTFRNGRPVRNSQARSSRRRSIFPSNRSNATPADLARSEMIE